MRELLLLYVLKNQPEYASFSQLMRCANAEWENNGMEGQFPYNFTSVSQVSKSLQCMRDRGWVIQDVELVRDLWGYRITEDGLSFAEKNLGDDWHEWPMEGILE
jgi:hypothetical protein